MAAPVVLVFRSRLTASADAVWEWLTSVRGITTELRPILSMTAPSRIRSLSSVEFRPGARLFRSYVFLFCVLPIDYSDLTLLELRHGVGFVEESPMGSMRLWRHERWIETERDSDALLLTDKLTFEPRLARPLVTWFIKKVFEHRHAILRSHLGGALRGGPAEVLAPG